ncbi:MAG: L-threonylcarbamoyladenylate synthase, partial [Armatimonadota bacterium]
MIVLRVNAEKPAPESIRLAADALRRGELVVFPTETVYGLAADALSEEAVRLVFEAKGRPQGQALPVQVAEVEQLSGVVREIPNAARVLAARFWPGPLTIVLPKSATLPDVVSGGKDTIGVRVPDHPVALALLREVARPIVA